MGSRITEVGWAKIGEPRRSLGAFRRWAPTQATSRPLSRRELAGAAALKTSLRPPPCYPWCYPEASHTAIWGEDTADIHDSDSRQRRDPPRPMA
jgi:hypothetical protein